MTTDQGDRTVWVTTSWDDGHRLDRRMAEELAAFGIPGTFYLSPQSVELTPAQRLDRAGVAALTDLGMEIGSHTLTHPHLDRIDRDAARQEITAGKAAAEELAGREVTSFCYPYGAYRPEHAELVREAGFRSARTIRRFVTTRPTRLFEMGTSVHASRYRADGLHLIRRSRGVAHWAGQWANWDRLARNQFQAARNGGGVFHLWGHSWEVEAHDDWDRLRGVLAFLAGQEDVRMVTNGELVSRLEAGDQA